ncbi:hypothetical protein NVP1084O_117 [Vibrio phage 1.084.O._10N.261.49.F5]|nr:hypothetical protein NVP1084O_117 [Vibrio phage 1.084.O._10N.261.49.F5]
MQFYLVGGACRDILMGLEPKDYDFVVVGASPQDMIDKGYKQVGKDFPVFLEPTHGWEVALARTERKTGIGYGGFETEWNGVTLEEDLARRDLTINSIAIEVDWDETVKFYFGKPVTKGILIDPFYGEAGIVLKVLAPTTDAFEEDPLRVIRSSRFLARYEDFTASDELMRVSNKLSLQGNLDELTPERVWLEFEKVLGEKNPSRFFDFLSDIGWKGLPTCMYKMKAIREGNDHHPEPSIWDHTMQVVNHAAQTWGDPEVTFSCVTHDFGKPLCYSERDNGYGHEEEGLPFIEEWCERIRTPKRFKELALMVCKHHQKVHACMGRGHNSWVRPKSIMKMFEETAALSKPERFLKLLKACESDSKGRGLDESETYEFTKEYFREVKLYPQRRYLEECLYAAINVDTKQISSKMLEEGKKGTLIGEEIRVARISAIRGVQNKWKNVTYQ